MTGKLVSLSKARKTKARAESRRQADANAAKFGRTKAEQTADAAKTDVQKRRLDDHRRDEE